MVAEATRRGPRPLQSGEVRVGRELPTGRQVYERVNERGSVERGYLSDTSEGVDPGANGLIQIGAELRPGVRRELDYIPFTARGPSQVASNAYRSGWDKAFGGKAQA